MEQVDECLMQAIATAMNYYKTGRTNKALEVVAQAKKVDPSYHMAEVVWHYLCWGGPRPKELKEFTGDWWHGKSLEGKSIEVFCDQGMGDTINCLRYLKVMKDRWDCKIVLNCFAFYDELVRFMGFIPYVDEFARSHVICDYYTDILSIPALLNELVFECYYPAHWQDLLDTPIPPMPKIDGVINKYPPPEPAFRVGLAHKSNAKNPELAAKKSVPLGCFAQFEDGVNELWSILPDTDRCNIMIQPDLVDLFDTATVICGLDAVVSVDTVTLHLAGSLGIRTLAVLPHDADARWGRGPATPWYPSVELFRQSQSLDWYEPIKQVKSRLVELRGS